MNYYCIDYCLRNENTMIYSHLPVNYLVTTDIDEANRWFDLAVKRAERGYENKLISVKDVPLDYMCNLREAVFESNECIIDYPGYHQTADEIMRGHMVLFEQACRMYTERQTPAKAD